ncbi:MAG: hypothetical protein KAX05_07090, partial [Bacteroidales bacterium]|nr:hypothetical protein [Bacteroidales bacterium]
MNKIFKSPYSKILLLGLLVHLITSYFSEGYFHPDEHFSILEFCNYKLGLSPASDLPWEFDERIRPALQPIIAFVIIKFLNTLCINNPFSHAFILRLFTAILAWFVISSISLHLSRYFSSGTSKKLFISMSLFLWFIPFINVRFSSETLSGIFFLLAVYLILLYNNNLNKKLLRLVLPALLLGFSFFLRFQIGFAIIGLGLWLLFINKMKWKEFLVLIGSGILVVSLCIFLDYWFYGELELTPINYFVTNIIKNKAANWGIRPWYYYFSSFTIKAVPPISIVLLVLFLIGLYKEPSNVFVWCFIPFLFSHMIVGHKELRFMFPMTYAFIYLSAIGLDFIISKYKFNKTWKFLFVFVAAINIILLLFKMLTPAQEAIKYYKFLYKYSRKEEITLLSIEKKTYELVGVDVNFYRSANIKNIVFNNFQQVEDYLNTNHPETVLLLNREFLLEYEFKDYNKRIIYSLFPKWIKNYNIN